jgi:hypothetical protein
MVGVVATLTMHGIEAKAAAGLIGAIGGGLASFISHVFLRTYRMSVQQLSYYYGQPHVNCYLLHAEHLADDLDGPDAKAARKAILRTILGAAERAQQQILVIASSTSEGGAVPNGTKLGNSAPSVARDQLSDTIGNGRSS